MKLTITDTEEKRQRYVMDDGKSILILTRIIIADPSEIFFTDIEDEVERTAIKREEGWGIIEHPIFGDFSADTKDELMSDLAQWLNDQGISVTDTVIRAYELSDAREYP